MVLNLMCSVPGTIMVHGAPIQILDLPGIIEGAKDGRGRGRQVIAVARSCSMLFIVLDVLKPMKDKAVIENELEGFGIRLNKKPANILIKKKDKGGITISNTVPLTKMDPDEMKAVLAEYKLSNCDVAVRQDATLDELIDVIEGNRCYLPVVYLSAPSLDFLVPRLMSNAGPEQDRRDINRRTGSTISHSQLGANLCQGLDEH